MCIHYGVMVNYISNNVYVMWGNSQNTEGLILCIHYGVMANYGI